MPTIIDGSASATFATPLPLSQGGTGNTSGNVVSSQVAGALNASGSAPLYACRAWVNFNGTGTVAIRASGNVSSITDNGTGDYTVNFTTAMQDKNYVANINTKQNDDTNPTVTVGTLNYTGSSGSSARIIVSNQPQSVVDSSLVTVGIVR